jgi:hypothetical protein
MSSYRKITPKESELLGLTRDKEKNQPYVDFVKKYYPSNSYSMTMVFSSEYNDCNYDNSLKYILVFDKEGNELLPIKSTAKECREKWYDLPSPIKPNYNYHGECKSFQTDDQIENYSIFLNSDLDLYVKEDPKKVDKISVLS